jgi:hypothetical protein
MTQMAWTLVYPPRAEKGMIDPVKPDTVILPLPPKRELRSLLYILFFTSIGFP